MRSTHHPLASSAAFLAAVLVSALFVVTLPGCSSPAPTAEAPVAQLDFATPEDAVVAFIDAARTGNVAAARPFFGEGYSQLESDVPGRTEGDLQRIAAAYDRRHELLIDTSSGDRTESVTLAVGDDLWEFPVPLVRQGDRWRFDTATGVATVVADRIAANELDAMSFLVACVPAEEQFRQLGTLGAPAYTTLFHSDRGSRNGLWWPDTLAPPDSPLGPMVDEAVASGAATVDDDGVPDYLGYHYRVLTAAGPAAPGGAANWLDSRGLLVGGFAFVAWPVAYGETGVRTFLVDRQGAVWARDLGAEGSQVAGAMTTFDPGAEWTPVVPGAGM